MALVAAAAAVRAARSAIFPSSRVVSVAISRALSDGEPGTAEQDLMRTLAAGFPGATDIAVVDVSGGCGAMYEVHVEAPQFQGVRIVKQHQMVTEVLKQQIKDMHGLRISTAVSEGKES